MKNQPNFPFIITVLFFTATVLLGTTAISGNTGQKAAIDKLDSKYTSSPSSGTSKYMATGLHAL